MWLFKCDIHKFANDNTECLKEKELKNLLRALDDESNSAVNRFRNNMIVNQDKFQEINRIKQESDMPYTLNLDQNVIKLTNAVNLLGVNIVHKLRLNLHLQTCVLKQQSR